MKNKIIWLRISYWAGAVIDALAALLLTFPNLMSFFYRLGPIDDTPAFRTADHSAAALMWGWTFLLLWGNHKPLERKGLILLTILPVLVLMVLYRFADVLIYQADLASNLPYFVLQFGLIGLFSFSLWINRDASLNKTVR